MDSESELSRDERAASFRQRVESLPLYLQPVVQGYREGLAPAPIAARLGYSVGTVEAHTKRAASATGYTSPVAFMVAVAGIDPLPETEGNFEDLRRRVRMLTPRQREILDLRAWGKEPGRIATLLGVGPANITNLTRAGLATLGFAVPDLNAALIGLARAGEIDPFATDYMWREAVLTVGTELTLDLIKGRGEWRGREHDVAQKALALLAHLMREPGRTFTADELADALGSSHAGVVEIVVRLREAFGKDLIRTVRETGYTIGADPSI
jgi:DNA-binding response OmpR family regulator